MIGAKLKIALLYDVWNEDPVAAAEKQDEPPARKTRRKKTKKKRKEMTDREEIFEALAKLGHEPSYFELDGRRQSLHSLSRCDADLIFNLTESFDGDDTKEMNVVAYVDLLGIPYTGAGPHSIFLAQDKAIALADDDGLCARHQRVVGKAVIVAGAPPESGRRIA